VSLIPIESRHIGHVKKEAIWRTFEQRFASAQNHGTNHQRVVILVAGGVDGLQSGNRQVLHQEIDSVNGIADDGDQFGFALAVGDVDADLRDDLAVGVSGEDFGTATDTGAGSELWR
jgi:hypothetical protein